MFTSYILFSIVVGYSVYHWKEVIWHGARMITRIGMIFRKPEPKVFKKPQYYALEKNKVVKYDPLKHTTYFCKNYQESDKLVNFRFICISLIINDKLYPIEINDDTHTHYLDKNQILTNDFVNWYAEHKFKSITPLDEYTISIIDQNANEISISENQFIELGKDCYVIKSNL